MHLCFERNPFETRIATEDKPQMTERTSLEDLKLQGNSSNLQRAQKRIAREKVQTLSVTADRKSEIAQLDELIAQALKTCRKGQTRNKKANPAFANLASLVKTRTLLLRGEKPTKKSTTDLVRQADDIFFGTDKRGELI
jgi:hypothetical protein